MNEALRRSALQDLIGTINDLEKIYERLTNGDIPNYEYEVFTSTGDSGRARDHVVEAIIVCKTLLRDLA